MNYKSARCSMHCFDDTSRKLAEVNSCLQVCRQGIKECHDFADKLQKQAEAELTQCTKDAEKQENLTEPVTHWISCYEKLLKRFDRIEDDVKEEFSNFV